MVNQAEHISWQLGQQKHAHSSTTQHCQYTKTRKMLLHSHRILEYQCMNLMQS
jgi:hypothetical protein